MPIDHLGNSPEGQNMKYLYEANGDRLVGNLTCTASQSSKETKPGRGRFDESDLKAVCLLRVWVHIITHRTVRLVCMGRRDVKSTSSGDLK